MSLLDASYKTIWRIAYPIIIGSFAQSIISATDTAFMGRIGSTEQAAIGLISVYYLILFMIGFSYTKGMQIMVARRLGERRYDAVGQITDNSLIIMLLTSVAIFTFLKLFSSHTLHFLVEDPDVRQAAFTFLNKRAYGIFFGYAGSLFLSFYMGIGNTQLILASIFIMSIINVLLNYLFIFGKLGLPAMGIAGAAWASNIAECVGCVIFLLHARYARYHQNYRMFHFDLSGKVMHSVTALSLPIVLQTLIGLAAWMIFFAFIEKMGKEALAISSIIKSLYTLFGIPAWGFASAVNTIVSNLMGQRKYNEVSAAIKKVIWTSAACTILICIPLMIFPAFFLRLFTTEVEVIKNGGAVVYVCVVALILYAVSTILFNGIVSTGTSKVSLMIELLSIGAYLIYIYFIHTKEYRTVMLMWTSEWCYWLIVGLLAYLYLKSGRWQQKVL